MATGAPPAYAQPANQGQASAVAAASNIKYVDQNGNPVPAPSANVKYVDQNGNPVNPPASVQQPLIKYVDQNGNPVAPPSQPPAQPTVKYVDQYGNPVAPPVAASAPPQPAIKYVDQNGNPVAPPSSVQPQPTVKYVDQFGNPVAPPVGAGAANIRYVDQNGNPVPPPSALTAAPKTANSNAQRSAATVFGIIGVLFYLIAFICDNLARDNDWYNDVITTCGFTEVRRQCDSYSYNWECSEASYSYGDLCHNREYIATPAPSPTYYYDSYDYPDYAATNTPNVCATQSAAGLFLTCMVFATLFGLIGTIYTQKWCPTKPLILKSHKSCGCGRVGMLGSLGFAIFAFIFWYGIADYCIGDNHVEDSYSYYYYDRRFNIGATIILFIIGAICMFIGGLMSKPDPVQ